MTDYVYFIEADNGLVKIGKSKDVRKRLSALRGSSPVRLWLLFSIDCGGRAHQTEIEFHKRFEAKRHHGEWYRLSTKDKKAITRIGAAKRVKAKESDYKDTVCPDCLKLVNGKRGLISHIGFCEAK